MVHVAMLCGIKNLFREPLVHFMISGAVIFAGYGLLAETDASSERETIVVTPGDVERLASVFERRRSRAPTTAEMQDLLVEHVRDEVLYREALSLGLDRDDAVVRRLLRQKYEFITQDIAVPANPSSDELMVWYQANRERYRRPAHVSFSQIRLVADPDEGKDGEKASLMLASLRNGANPDTLEGVAAQLLVTDFSDLSVTEVAAQFGQAFADSISLLPPGVWSGPIRSGYGLHLVRVGSRRNGDLPPFDTIDEQVRDDFLYQRRREANDAVYARLLKRYKIIVKDASLRDGSGQERP